MKKIMEILSESNLFQGLSPRVFEDISSRVNTRMLLKGEIFVNEGVECNQVIVVVSGQLVLQKYSGNGDFITIDLLEANSTFGEDIVLGDQSLYPVTIEALVNTRILTISKEILYTIFHKSNEVTQTVVRNLSNKIMRQRRQIIILSQRNLRQKIATYLIELLKEQTETEDIYSYLEKLKTERVLTPSVEIKSSKEVAARLLAMSRPSFSRELVRMEKDGLIKLSGHVIWLTDIEGLEQGGETGDEDFFEEIDE